MKMSVLLAVLALVPPSFAEISPSDDTTGKTDYAAITAAVAQGGTVELGEGTFYVNQQIELTSAVTLKGAGRDVTIIKQTSKSGNTQRIVYLNHAEAVLEGVTVSDGYVYNSPNDGAGVCIDANGGTVLDCRITNCESSMNTYGALALKGAAAVAKRTIIDGNFNKNGYGGCPGVSMGKGILENCLVTGNYITSCTSRAFPVAGGVCILRSLASTTGTIMRNCTITDNTGRDVGGFCAYDGFGDGAFTAENCIISGNKVVSNSAKATDSRVHAPEACYNTASYFVNCCFEDAKFKSSTDFHLSGASPCRGAADYVAWMAGVTDLDGVAFAQEGKVDLGCYQYVASETFTCSAEASSQKAFEGDTVTLTAVLEPGTDASKYVFSWKVGEELTAEGVSADVTLESRGAYVVVLTVTDASSGATVFEGGLELPIMVYEKTISIAKGDDIAATFADVVDGQEFVFTDADTYEFADEVVVTAGVTIRGQGRDKTILTMKSGVNKRFFTLNNSGATLSDVTLQGGGGKGTNISYGDGGAIYIDVKGGTVADCRLTGNHCGMNDSGMAVYMASANAHVRRCIIDHNTSSSPWPSGGAVTMTAGTLENCLVCQNEVSDGTQRKYYVAGGVTLKGGSMANCTVSANSGRGAGGVAVSGLSGVCVKNCVIFGNTVATSVGVEAYPDASDFAGKDANLQTSLVSPAADPFRSFAAADYRLGANSPALGTGTYEAAMDDELDLDGNPRTRDSSVDIGCYENIGYDDWIEVTAIPDQYGSVEPTFGLKDGLSVGDKVTCTLTSKPTGDGAPAFMGWRIEDADGNEIDSDATESFEYEHNGEYRRIVWLWATKFPMVVTTDGGGAVSVSADKAAYGESVTFMAIPDTTIEGVVFWKWEGDVPAGQEAVNPLTITVDAAKTLKAVFGASKTYVASITEPNEQPRAPFTTVETAANSIEDALSVTVDGGTVDLLSGVHELSNMVSIARSVCIRGQNGRDLTTVRRVYPKKEGILRLFLLDDPGATLEGLTLTGGYTYGSWEGNGSAVRIGESGGIVRDCLVCDNETSMNCVGAIALFGVKALVSRTVVTDNFNNDGNGNCPGVYLGAGVMDNCLIYSNRITNCSARKFQVPGGVQMNGGIMSNCTVTANFGRGVGGICFYDGYNWKGGQAVNCIVYGNSAQEDYSVETSPEYYSNDAKKIPNCLFTDPKFVDAANMDFHLQKDSPAINAGTYAAWMDAATDLDGNPRVKHVKRYRATGEIKRAYVDLGCYETEWRGPGFLLWVR